MSRAHNGFDHIRLFAAGLVLYSHHFALWGLPEPQALTGSYGGLGVAIFFALSGYLVSASFANDPHAGRFMARRLLRIMPGLTVNVLACLLVFGLLMTALPWGDYLRHQKTAQYLLNLLFNPQFALPGVLEQPRALSAINGSLWTLPFEMAAYVLLAALGSVMGRHLRWLSPVLLVVAIAVALSWHPQQPVVFWGNDLRHLPAFLAYFFFGATLAHGGERLLESRWLLALPVVFLMVPHEATRVVVASLLALGLAVQIGRRPIADRLALRHDCSYGVYLYAFPVQQAVIARFADLGFWPTMLLAALLTWACAWLSWTFVESPALKFKPRGPARGEAARQPGGPAPPPLQVPPR